MALILQQTKAEQELVLAFKDYASNHNEKLQDVYARAVKEFIDVFNNHGPGESKPLFYSSPSAGKTLNLKLPESLKDTALSLANKEQSSARRFYYTALVRFALDKELINSH